MPTRVSALQLVSSPVFGKTGVLTAQCAVRHLALQYPSSAFNNGPLLIYLTARNKERGETAVQSLQSDHELEKAKALSGHGGLTDVKYHALDIGQTNSIRQFSDFLKKEHPDGIDVVVNNAGIGMDGFGKPDEPLDFSTFSDP